MKYPLLAACLACLAAACVSRTQKASVPSSRTQPTFGRIAAVWEVVDKQSRERVGFVDKMTYDDGRELFWVRDPRRTRRLGYVTTGNQAFKYTWHVGQRSEKAEFIGADTISSNTRRILGYDHPVELMPTTLRKLVDEIGPRPADEPQAEGPAEEEE